LHRVSIKISLLHWFAQYVSVNILINEYIKIIGKLMDENSIDYQSKKEIKISFESNTKSELLSV
jgi:hypothetical protein